MFDQAFNYSSLSRGLRKSDFFDMPSLRSPTIKDAVVNKAVDRAANRFSASSPISYSTMRGKRVYRIDNMADDLVLRKVSANIKNLVKVPLSGRDAVIANIKRLIAEGVPYRVYRLDVRGFFESFDVSEVFDELNRIPLLSIPTKEVARAAIAHYQGVGGRGLPRGLALSSTLSELMMMRFDRSVRERDGVFFYSRYVDDIVIITDASEDVRDFLEWLDVLLPNGLEFSRKSEKKNIAQVSKRVAPNNGAIGALLVDFDYLGYRFKVFEPKSIKDEKKLNHFREVWIDISESKVSKIKTRIIRSIIDFNNNGDMLLLHERMRLLTSNFSVRDKDRERKRLAGIYYNYHQISVIDGGSLDELDGFLRSAILSGKGKVLSRFMAVTSKVQRQSLLRYSFKSGFVNKNFSYFSAAELKRIQGCWDYA